MAGVALEVERVLLARMAKIGTLVGTVDREGRKGLLSALN